MTGEIVDFPHRATEEGRQTREKDAVTGLLYAQVKMHAMVALENGLSVEEVNQWVESAMFAFNEENKKG